MAKFCARFIGIVLFFVLAAFSFAQEAQISFAEGGEFALSADGKRTTYQADKLNAEALSLRNEDILQTGAGSFVELRLEPSGTRIKIAENTSLVCKGQGPESNSLSFTLLYGRIRLSTMGGWSPDTGIPVFIEAGQAETVFREGDAGVDFLYDTTPSPFGKTEPIMRIYGFSGKVELLPVADIATDFESRPRLPIPDYESVTIEVMNPFSFIERKPVENGIIHYWNIHNFSGSSRLLASRSPLATATSTVPDWVPSGETDSIQHVPSKPARNIKILKDSMLITGLIFLAGGLSLQIVGQQHLGGIDSHTGNALSQYGYMQSGTGLLLSGASLFLNPRQSATNAAK